MNILNLIRLTFSPKTFQEENPTAFDETKKLLTNHELREKFFYKSEEEEILTLEVKNDLELDKIAKKHFEILRKELNIHNIAENDNYPFNLEFVLDKIAALLLFAINPWMIYKTFLASLYQDIKIYTKSDPFLFSVATVNDWNGLTVEMILVIISIPVLVFLVSSFFLSKLGKIKYRSISYLFLSFSIFLTWNYYGVTGSESLFPISFSIFISLIGIFSYLKIAVYKKR